MDKGLVRMDEDVRETYTSALVTLARAFSDYKALTGRDPVLVGGGAVCIYTDGQFISGDLDFIAGNDRALSGCMEKHGFVREDRSGRLRFGWYHPDHPQYGFQQVTGPLFDGKPVRTVQVTFGDTHALMLPSVEDMIADRLAQHAVASATDTSRLEQARAMFALVADIDRDYLNRRIVEEGGDPALLQDYGAVHEPGGFKP